MSQKELEETNKSGWGTSRTLALKMVSLRSVCNCPYLHDGENEVETKVTVLFSKGGTVPVVPLLLHSD